MANSTGELMPIPAIRKLVMGGSEKARLVPARVDGTLAKWRRHYGEPKGLSGKSSLNFFLLSVSYDGPYPSSVSRKIKLQNYPEDFIKQVQLHCKFDLTVEAGANKVDGVIQKDDKGYNVCANCVSDL